MNMRAKQSKLQIGNEMREGRFRTVPVFQLRGGWLWEFRTQNINIISTTSLASDDACRDHFKSIGGIILGDAE